MKEQQASAEDLKKLDALAKLMDAQFWIPGTNIRFGLDALIGLVPGAGDFFSFLVSSYLVSIAIKKGASGFVLARMILNMVIDALIGAIPVLGDIFDVAFRANQRNVRLLQQHYGEGRHRGSARKLVIPVLIVMLALFAGLTWLFYKLITWIF